MPGLSKAVTLPIESERGGKPLRRKAEESRLHSVSRNWGVLFPSSLSREAPLGLDE